MSCAAYPAQAVPWQATMPIKNTKGTRRCRLCALNQRMEMWHGQGHEVRGNVTAQGNDAKGAGTGEGGRVTVQSDRLQSCNFLCNLPIAHDRRFLFLRTRRFL